MALPPTIDADWERRLLDWIAKVYATKRSPALAQMSEFEKTILLPYQFELQVSNGGIHQFFKNPSGDWWAETLTALHRIGAGRICSIFERALAVFPGNSPSTDHCIRADQLQAAEPLATEILDQLTDEYYDLNSDYNPDEMYTLLSKFLESKG